MKANKLFFFFLILLANELFAQPVLNWSMTYNGTQSSYDESRLLYVDASGNSYFGGYASSATGGNDVAVFKYSAAGTQLWMANFNGGWSGIDWANSLAVDASGNVYITGYSTDPLGNGVVIKFNSSGVYQWETFFSSTFSDEGASIATDGVYVYATANDFVFSHFNNDFITVKLDCATGTLQAGWPQYYNSTYNSDDVPTSLAIDASGNVYVTGYSKHATNSPWNQDYATIAYNSTGTVLAGWPQLYNGPGNDNDVPAQILLSGTNVVVTGYSTGSGTNWDICTIMYTSGGATVAGWPQRYNGTASGWDGVGNTNNKATYKPMAIDPSGNVYICGWVQNTGSGYDIGTFKYNSSGVLQAGWPQMYNQSNADDIGRGIALDAGTDVYITGYTTNGGGSQDIVTIQYSSAGVIQTGWPMIWNGPANGADEGLAISVVGSCVWVTGNATNGVVDMATLNYCGIIILPVELLSFDAAYNTNTKEVELSWATASEKQNDYFTIEKSRDGKNWQSVKKIKGGVNSNRTLYYSAIDESPFGGISYYRLRQTDLNGRSSYSSIATVQVNTDLNSHVFPNPNSGQFKISYDVGLFVAGGKNEIVVYDVLGKIIYNSVFTDGPSDIPLLEIDLGKETKGLLFFKLLSEGNCVLKGKILVQ